jgi:hypothetical protein
MQNVFHTNIRYFSSEKEHLKIGEKQLKYSQKLEY